MRMIDILVDTILDTRLFENALRRREVESKITDLAYPIFDHLIKIIKWQDSINYSKHCQDIDNWLSRIQNYYYKGNKKPNQYDYFQWMFHDVIRDQETVSRQIRNMTRYQSLLEIRTKDEVYQILKSIIYQISYDLPVNKFETITDYLPTE